MIEIIEATEVTPDLVAAFARLTPQLSSSSPAPTAGELAEIVASPATILLLAIDRADANGNGSSQHATGDSDAVGGEIIGSMTLALFRIPTGLRAWIEDVVVDESARGKGVAATLNLRALELAAERGARTVDLTSRPSREAANRLYRRLGFVARETNVYRFSQPD